MAWFEVSKLRKEYPLGESVKVALRDFSLSAERGDFVSIIGRSGSGKTTFLRLVAGLSSQTSGEIKYSDGRKPRIGMVFQEPRLMPWLTVEENVVFPYKPLGRKNLPLKRARALLEMLGILDYKDAYPSALSGGMAQRAALGRALCREPELILMDEPLGALDYFTRNALREEILNLYMTEAKTILFVTHDVDEAVAMSRRIVVLDEGEIVCRVKIDLDYPRKRTDPAFAAIVEQLLVSIAR
ncbi:MAG: ABC transporter ATP-binding protein [Synergistaceae bacterium]|jgi:sulfonate transport system ATP-binding protein|nr:ABC transporter ATP-binding protein [Synergistaceae bacterium]